MLRIHSSVFCVLFGFVAGMPPGVTANLAVMPGASFRALTLLRAGKFDIAVSVPLVLEYEAVLRRHAKKLGLGAQEVPGLVDYLCNIGHRQDIHFLWRPALRDPRDEFVLELAVAAECSAIVTHNVRDFKGAKTFGIKILTPAEFISRVEAIP